MKKYEIGDVVTGKVTGVLEYGIFLSLEDGTTGLIHISEISNSFVRNVNDYAEINEVIKAKVIDNDDKTGHLKLSVKNLMYRDKSKYARKIKETKRGFSTLRECLNEWILVKLNQLDKKK